MPAGRRGQSAPRGRRPSGCSPANSISRSSSQRPSPQHAQQACSSISCSVPGSRGILARGLRPTRSAARERFARLGREGAGVGRRDGPDEVVHLPGALVPVDAPVLRPASAEVAALRAGPAAAAWPCRPGARAGRPRARAPRHPSRARTLRRRVVRRRWARTPGPRCVRRRASPPSRAAWRRSRARRGSRPSSPARGRGTSAAASRAC